MIRNTIQLQNRKVVMITDTWKQEAALAIREAKRKYCERRKALKDAFPDGQPDDLRQCFPIIED